MNSIILKTSTNKVLTNVYKKSIPYFGYCTKSETKIKPPIQIYGIAARYTNSLYISAVKSNTLDHVVKDMESIRTELTKYNALTILIRSSLIWKVEKARLLKHAAQTVSINYIYTLIKNIT